MKAKIHVESQVGSIDLDFETDKEFSSDDFKDLLAYIRANFGGGDSNQTGGDRAATDKQTIDPQTREMLSKMSFDQYMEQLGADDLQKTIGAAVIYIHFAWNNPMFTEADVIKVMEASSAASKIYQGGSIAKELGGLGLVSPVPDSPGTYSFPMDREQLLIPLLRPR